MKNLMSDKPTPFTTAKAAKPDAGVNSVRLRLAGFLGRIEYIMGTVTFYVMGLRQRLDPLVWNRD